MTLEAVRRIPGFGGHVKQIVAAQKAAAEAAAAQERARTNAHFAQTAAMTSATQQQAFFRAQADAALNTPQKKAAVEVGATTRKRKGAGFTAIRI